MLKGRYTCEQLKAIRSEIAKANDIDYTPSVCNYQGICRGTCPACEAERHTLSSCYKFNVSQL